MKQDDFIDMMKELVPRMIEQTSDVTRSSSASASSGSQKRSHEVSVDESEPAASRPRSLATEALSVEDMTHLFDSWDQCPDIEVLVANYMQKKQSKEVAPTGHAPNVQRAVDDSKVAEWQTLIEKGALKLHYGRKAQQLKEKYPERFMGSRFVITRKPLEENQHVDEHDPSTYRVKSRWCLQGHLDPDLDAKLADGLLQSPTLSQIGRMLLMQLITSHQWDLELGDIKGAFLEAGPVPQKYRPLFARQPRGGIPGVPIDAVIEVVGNVYGQNDAPLAWYRAFDTEATAAGWERSKFDSCLYFLRTLRAA